MDTRDVVFEKTTTLLQSVLDADASDRIGIVLALLESTQKLRRETSASSELGHALQSADRRYRHNAGDDWDVNASERTAFAEIEKIVIIEEKLCDDVVGARAHLRFKLIHLHQSDRCRRMSFGETSDADPETAAVGMRAGIVKATNEFDQVNCVPE